MQSNTIQSSSLNSASVYWLMASLTVAALPHFIYQPFWVGLIFTAMMGWRLMHHLRHWPLPAASRRLKLLQLSLAGLSLALTFATYGLTIGRDAGTALLVMMLAFKVVETHSPRDFYLCCFLGLFVVITNFFFTEAIWMAALMCLSVLALISCLVQINTPVMTGKQRLRLSGKLLLQAMPLMLVLFILFPRISGPLWGQTVFDIPNSMPERMTLGEVPPTGTTGASNEMQVGKISQLIQSDEIAFRVEFADERPPQSALYWRGPVLWETDGTRWSPIDTSDQTPTLKVAEDAPVYQYVSTLEAHNKRWLFPLDFPSELPADTPAEISGDGLLQSRDKIERRQSVELTSHTRYVLNPDEEPHLSASLQLPADLHPQSRRLASRLADEADDDGAYIEAVLDYYRQQNFVYTLTPPALKGDTIDQFLFESRAGFCEHYAASFTVLMRAAGIPARVVTGYQGGEFNPVDEVMTVRQRDAHAWAEVWLPVQGWIRIDPTAAVSNQRVNNGITELLPPSRQGLGGASEASSEIQQLWKSVNQHWQAVNNAWDMWVVDYGPQKQLDLLKKLGFSQPDWRLLTLIFAAAAITVMSLILFVVMRQYRDADPVSRSYELFCRKLARVGLNTPQSEGPENLARRAKRELPAQAAEIDDITKRYIALRYRNIRHEEDKLMFKRAVRRFHPKQKP